MKCPHCGQEFEGNFCPNCGTAVQSEIPSQKPTPATPPAKKPKKKHGCLTAIWVAVVVLFVIGLISSLTEIPNSSSTASGSAATSSPTPSDTPAPTKSPAPEPEIAASEDLATSDSDSSGDMTLDLMAAAFKLTLQDSFKNSDLTYDDTSITMTVWEDDVAAGAFLAQQGNEELQDAWNDMRENMRKMCQAARDSLDKSGFENVSVTLNLQNDMNEDNVLLSVVDGVVVYDAVYGYSMDEIQ